MNKVLKFILQNMNFSQEFPANVCKIPHKVECGVFDSDVWFYCLVIDERFDDEVVIKKMKPYVYKDNKQTFYGWVDTSGNIVLDYLNGGGKEDEKVWGWVKIQDDES